MHDECINLAEERQEEECGVFGVYAPGKDVARLSYYGLYALQHRGQESAGIAVSDGENIKVKRGMGLVSDVFESTYNFKELDGFIANGHVRYSTSGESALCNAQPLIFNYARGQLSVCHNGNLVNGRKLRKKLESLGSIFQTTTDSELIAHLISRSAEEDFISALKEALLDIKGAFTFVFMTENMLIGVRDPAGIRPLSIGQLSDGSHVIASETCAFDTVGADFVKDVNPGEMVIIDEKGIRYESFAEPKGSALCIFEYIYFARPDSNIDGKNVHLVRKELGRQLFREFPVEADIVTGVPDSSLSAASGFAEEAGLPFEMGLIKNKYIGRTFIQPNQDLRDLGVKLKLSPVKKILAGKRVVMIDDSIVRGTTSTRIVDMLKSAGAKEVHVRISSAPVKACCYYGIDTSRKQELIANRMAVEEIGNALGSDSLGYLSIEGMVKSVGLTRENFCLACFDGCYPVKNEDDE